MLKLALPLTLVACLALALATSAGAAKQTTLTVSPKVADFGQKVTIKGTGWPRIEFCKPRVRLSLRSTQNRYRIGVAKVKANGRFNFSWTPKSSKVGSGRWKLFAVQPCENGSTGKPNPLELHVRFRIR
jgi:hypothetical protein